MHTSLPDNNRNMIIHILLDVAQKPRGKNTNDTERNAHVINVLVALCIRELARCNHNLVCGIVALDSGDLLEQR